MIDTSKLNEQVRKDLEEAYYRFERDFQEVVDRGHTEMLCPAPKIADLFCFDERQDFFAKYLRDRGYRVVRKARVIAGVLQVQMLYVEFV